MSAELGNGKKNKADRYCAEDKIIGSHELVDKGKVKGIGDEIKHRGIYTGKKIEGNIVNQELEDGNATGDKGDKETGESGRNRDKMNYTGSNHCRAKKRTDHGLYQPEDRDYVVNNED